ncbi:hypothetical protein DPMN_068105 [Dreissena polymorpha]|uniref:Uncharacterized protein n=1 Tax=Dreissena polymorpha TaxID=45954 RepID=A0A9D4BWC5_DREPO|nr:hypothetical protein DPMN_068105 [Dreissena polymorpha]
MNMIQCWYDGLFKYLTSDIPDFESLVKDPRRLFNVEESGFPLCISPGKVLAAQDSNNV